MSTSVIESPAIRPEMELDEFNYRPTPIIVPIGLVLAIVSSASVLGLFGIVIAFVAFCISLAAIIKVTRSDGMYTGRVMASIALCLSLMFGSVGIAMQIHAFKTEVMPGYARISFSRDISAKGFIVEQGKFALHPDVARLIDQKVFLKGYMYPQRQKKGLHEFLLLKDTGECCFGGQPKPTDMILVKVEDEQGTDYRTGRVSVTGTLRLTKDTTPEGLEPIYALEAVRCERSKSAF